MAGLKRKLHNKLSPQAAALRTAWEVGQQLGTLWRPNADSQLYPYLPSWCTRPKEVRKLYAILLPERCYFAVRCHSAPDACSAGHMAAESSKLAGASQHAAGGCAADGPV